jgi:hypothetical protein
MPLFDGVNRWWRQSSTVKVSPYRPPYSDPEVEAVKSSVLRARYPDSPIYRDLAQTCGYDPLRTFTRV